jgi:uncharacterized protein
VRAIPVANVQISRVSGAFAWGALIGTLGGLIGLGGAEFRLPVLVNVYRYRTLQALQINLFVSLVTVIFSFIFRAGLVTIDQLAVHTPVIFNILPGSLAGAYLGSHYARKLPDRLLRRWVVVLLVGLSLVLIGHHYIESLSALQLTASVQLIAGLAMGVAIGIVSSMLGVAGGELIIPTLVILYTLDIRLAGSLSLVISIPTIVVGLLRYVSHSTSEFLRRESSIVIPMVIGSIPGAWIGSFLLRFLPVSLLHIILGMILLVSAVKLARHHR